MSDINKFTSKEVLNKVLLDSSGNAVEAFSHTTQEALNAALDTTNNRLNVSLAGGTISGDVTISGDLTVNGSATNSYDEIVNGQLVAFRDDSSTVGTNDNIVIENDGAGDASLKFSLTGATDWFAYVDNSDSDKFKIRRSTSDFLIITETGSVGLGATPTNNLHIEADSGDEGITIHSAGDTGNAITIDANRSSADAGIGTMLGKWNGTLIGYMGFFSGSDTSNKDDGVIKFATTPSGGSATVALTIDSSQNVFIGTSADTAKYLKFARGGSGTGSVRGSIGTNNSKLTFIGGSGTSPHMTLDSSGNLGIGTVSPMANSDGIVGLEISSGASTGLSLKSTSSSQIYSLWADSSGNLKIQDNTNNETRLTVDSSGDATFGGDVTISGGDMTLTGATTSIIGEQSAGANRGKIKFITSGSDGDIAFETTTNGAGAISERMRIAHDGYIGIGSNDPTEELTLVGAASSPATSGTGRNGILAVESSNGNSLYVGGYTASPFAMWLQVSNSASQDLHYPLALNPNGGSVGINENDPDTKLHIKSSTSTDGITLENSSAGAMQIQFKADSALRALIGVDDSNGNALLSSTSGFDYAMVMRSEQEIHFGTNGNNTAMVIDTSQNVGIGTSSPTHLLDLYAGSANAEGGIHLTNDDTGQTVSDGVSIFVEQNTKDFFIRQRESADVVIRTNDVTRFVIDNNSRISLSNNDSGTLNTRFGYQAGNALASGSTENTIFGHQAGLALSTGDYNTAIGALALKTEDAGNRAVAVGTSCMFSQNVSDVSGNVAVGFAASYHNVTGVNNTAIGYEALGGASGNSHSNNVGVGYDALHSITTGDNNVAIGSGAGDAITTTGACTLVGFQSGTNINHSDAEGTVALGYKSLELLTNGRYNTAIGYASLATSANGDKNTAVGFQSLGDVTGSSDGENTAIGFNAGHTGTDNLTTGTQNTLIGASTQATASGAVNQTVIGYGAISQSNNSVTLGNSSVTSIFAPTKTAIQSYGTVAITDGSTITLAGSNLGAAILCIYEGSGGIGGVFALSYQFAAVQLAGSADTSTSDSAGDVCVINGTNNHTVTIKNNTGAQKNFRIMIYSAALN